MSAKNTLSSGLMAELRMCSIAYSEPLVDEA